MSTMTDSPSASSYDLSSPPTKPPTSPHPLSTLLHHLKTIYLFTLSDHLTFILPQTLFGILSALSGPALTSSSHPTPLLTLSRLPQVLLWTWLNTFIFTLSNQASPSSIKEDALNKPWRPLPSGRITLPQTRRLLLLSIPAILAFTKFSPLGGFEETATLFSLTWMYNQLHGADDGFVTRNLIIALGYVFYGSGALRVATGAGHGMPFSAWTEIWLGITGMVIFTTMSVQDLKDVEGDEARGRRTAVIVLGDGVTRYGLAAGVVGWSGICAGFWAVGWGAWAATVGFGGYVAWRLVWLRNRDEDRKTWKLWALWIMGLYALPLCGDVQARSWFHRFV